MQPMRYMGEMCRRPLALGRFLRNRKDDVKTRLQFLSYRRGDLQDKIDGISLTASKEDIEARLIHQDQEFLNQQEAGLLTPQWRRYGKGRLVVIFQTPRTGQNGRINQLRQPV